MPTRSNPALEPLLHIFRQSNALKRLPRTGWLLAGVPQAESLADHTCAVALYTLFLAEAINQDLEAQGLQGPLDIHRAVSLALIHDLAESVLTDLPKRAGQLLGPEVKHAAESRAITHLLADLPGGPELTALWHEYDAAASPEARLVKDVDRLEMVYQAVCYAQAGHRDLHEFLDGHRWHYPLCQALFQALRREFIRWSDGP